MAFQRLQREVFFKREQTWRVCVWGEGGGAPHTPFPLHSEPTPPCLYTKLVTTPLCLLLLPHPLLPPAPPPPRPISLALGGAMHRPKCGSKWELCGAKTGRYRLFSATQPAVTRCVGQPARPPGSPLPQTHTRKLHPIIFCPIDRY